MSNQTGYLTVYSVDKSEIYGEFADAEWASTMEDEESTYLFTGTASDGTLATFQQLDNDGISHVAYTFESNGRIFRGEAELLAPKTDEPPSHAQIRLETDVAPIPD